MVHLRVLAPPELARKALELFEDSDCVVNVVHLAGVGRKPAGDVVLCDVAREEASVVISDLRHMGIAESGSIAIETLDSEISAIGLAAEKAAAGLPSDAVVWEELESRTQEGTELSGSFLLFMVLAMLIAACGIALDSPILIVGAMVVGPEFGPLAGLSVALAEKRPQLVRRSLLALVVGFPLGIVATYAFTEILLATGLLEWTPGEGGHPFTAFISRPDAYSLIVALIAGVVGTVSLTTAKSGALVGVLISVTTIPAAANVGFAAAVGDWHQAGGALLQLTINLTAIVTAGFLTLFIQRRRYIARRARHLRESDSAGS